MTIDTQKFKTLLEKEKTELENALGEIGQKNPSNPADWEGKPEDIDEERADKNDTADNIEEYEMNTAVVAELESRLESIEAALKKIEQNTFGTCRVCGNEIEEDRLGANPAAETCKSHLES